MIILTLDPAMTEKEFVQKLERDYFCTCLIAYRYPDGMKFDVQAAIDKMDTKMRAIMKETEKTP